MATRIRMATRRDALHAVALIDIAGHGIELGYWLKNLGDDHSPIAAARRLAVEDDTLPYHISKCHLLETDGEIAGGLFGEKVAETSGPHPDVEPYIEPLLALESRVPGYWSVVAVAVYPEHRGKGYGRVLLGHARTLAHETRSKGLSIVVEDTNTAALDLYRRFGFTERERLPWRSYGGRSGPKDWVLLAMENP